MKKRGLLGLLLACMVMLGASMTVFAADKVIDCNKDVNSEYVNRFVVSGGETVEIKAAWPTSYYIIEGIPSYSETQKETFFYIFKSEGNNTEKYILTSYSGDWAKGEYKFCFDKYTEGKPSGQQPTGKQPQPAAQSSSQSTSQMAEEPGEQLGGGLKNTNISSNG